MPFLAKDLRVIAYAGGFTLWHYRSSDSKQDVADNRYFASAVGVIRKGDIIIVEINDNNNNRRDDLEVAIFVVASDTSRRFNADMLVSSTPELGEHT